MPDTEPTADINSPENLEKRRLAQETKDERHVWIFLAWFLFGIHIIAFVMIYAVHHAP
ncbi:MULTISPECIES: hypothetical protein [Streptomyces]|uniref:Uncharacterized protein n=1 Tax=Streptomyces antibioticus TaxID=1890 RepID=A0AAE6YC01_STRAT|nr:MULTISPECIES: hypothetical protein [Streptomyces]MBO7941053.1 hypothetical protein [Streptomyces sp. S9]MCX4737522.1 hypothetical protein [Streptomyces antibioticus]MCX5170715.1 hypothetical protein [Streptomyces antibioticus]NUV62187.1 hypothetical protein [Streptomyces sp. CAI-85]QIT45939.1 hypothetical protein HCX60_22435 [Streptomyces antibioticus]